MESLTGNWTLVVPFVVVLAVLIIYRQRMNRIRTPRKIEAKLVEKTRVSHDTFLYTFLLPQQDGPLGLRVGEHIQTMATVADQVVERKYTPVSEINKMGTIDLLIKVYGKCEKFPEGGRMSQHIDSLKIGESLAIKYPYGRFNYMGNGRVRIRNIGLNPTYRQISVDTLYMIAGGTGITPLFQVIQYICSHPDDKTGLVLLFLNRCEQDLLLTNQLSAFQKSNPRLKVHYSVDRITTSHWTGFSGFLDKQKIEGTIPTIKEGLMCVSCGPPILSNIAQKIWKELGVNNEAMFRF